MNQVKKAGAIFLALLLSFSVAACGLTLKPKNGTETESQTEMINEEQAAGVYTLFAVEVKGYLVEKAALGLESELKLEEGGGGFMTINDDGGPVTDWSVTDGQLSVTSGVATMPGTVSDGVLTLDMGSGMVMYYATEEANLSPYTILTAAQFEEVGGPGLMLLSYGEEAYFGTGSDGYDEAKAKEYFEAAAEAGNADAWVYLGKIHETSSEKGALKEMMKCYDKAEEKGSLLALYHKGRCYMWGIGVKEDYAKAQSYFQQAIAKDFKEANKGLGELYMYGYGVQADAQQALTFFTAALEGSSYGITHSAMVDIGDLYYYGMLDVAPDYEEALSWYRKAADDGFSTGYVVLGWAYLDGNGVTQDAALAKQYFEQAASLGDSDGMRALANMYYNGNGVEKDLAEALKWYKKAGDRGNAESSMIAAGMYLEGEGTKAKPKKAAVWYEKAARGGMTDAYQKLGDLYHLAQYKNVDEAKALKYYKQAAKNNDPYSTARVGSFYYWGYGGEKINFKKAVKNFKKAAKSKHSLGQYYMGVAYYQGNGVKQNDKSARKEFLKAAKQGNANGQMWAGYMCYKGLGGKKDLTRAKKLLNKALKSGSLSKADQKEVKKWLKEIKKK